MAYPTVAFVPVDSIVGLPPINATVAVGSSAPFSNSGTPAVPSGIQALNQIGMRVKAWDPNFGVGEFIWLNGLAATAAGDVCIYNETTGVTKRGVAGDRGPVCVAMSANLANFAGWYQIAGAGPVNTAANTVAAGANGFWTAAAGALDDAVVATDKIDGLTFKAVNSGGFATVEMDRPSANGNG